MAIEKLKTAARAAQPTVINMAFAAELMKVQPSYLGLGGHGAAGPARCPSPQTPVAMVSETISNPSQAAVKERLRQPYPHGRVIVLDDDVNTFQHVVEALVRHLPAMTPDRAWALAHQIDGQGSAVVWSGPLEQAELYHQLLQAEGLTMAPLERA